MTVIARHELHCEWCKAVATVYVGYGYDGIAGGLGLCHAGKEAPDWVVLQLPAEPVGPGHAERADAWVKKLRVACPEHRPILAEYAKELWLWLTGKSEQARKSKETEDNWLWANRQPVLKLLEVVPNSEPAVITMPLDPRHDIVVIKRLDRENKFIEALGAAHNLVDLLSNESDLDDAMAENSHGVMHATNGWTILLNGEYLPELEG